MSLDTAFLVTYDVEACDMLQVPLWLRVRMTASQTTSFYITAALNPTPQSHPSTPPPPRPHPKHRPQKDPSILCRDSSRAMGTHQSGQT